MSAPDYRGMAAAAARKYGIPPAIFLAQINQESGFNPNAKSPAGALGIAQIVPRYHPGVDPMNPAQALDFAAKWDSQNFSRYRNWNDVLSVYNSGRPWAQGQRISETANYVHSIIGKSQGGQGVQGIGAPQPQYEPPNATGTGINQKALASLLSRASAAAVNGAVLPRLAAQIAALRVGAVGMGSPAAPSAPTGQPGSVVGAPYSVVGTPYAGTHTLGNWQSDDAVDLKVPVGTPVYALENGTIGPRIGPLGNNNPRFAGNRVTLMGGDNEFYYAHLSRLNVTAGQRVRKGDLIGFSGEANGVPHLHLGVMNGDPRRYLR